MTRRARDPGRPTVTLIPGDGIGPEVTSAAVEVMEAAGASLEWDVQLAGKAALERIGMHGEYGRISVLQMMRHVVAHDENHLRQIEAARAAKAKATAKRDGKRPARG